MKSVKFRAWDKERKEYLSGGHVLLVVPQGRGERQTTLCLDLFEHPDRYRERFDLEQFTGLHDKVEREIYEGDIIEIDHDLGEKSKTTVVFQDGGFVVEDDFGEADLLTVGWAIEAWDAAGDTYTVIGNIHENPELLKL